MSVEVTPVDNSCNIACSYCYQHGMRDANPFLPTLDVNAMKKGIEAAKPGTGGFTIFGGEALMTPLSVLEELWKWGLEKYGSNGVQTNGTLITTEHIRMFKQYRVGVGVSIDGPGPLNDARWAGSLERTRDMTARSEAAIKLMCDEKIPPSLIVTLSRRNASFEALPTLIIWFARLAEMGVKHVNLHSLEVDNELVGEHLALSHQELIYAFRILADAQDSMTLRFEPFTHMVQLLQGDESKASCVWHACDPYTTAAVQGVDSHGESTNCGRTNKEGISWRKPEEPNFLRQVILYETPQEDGGCKDCRFFLMCKGQCPGEAIDGDWRNKTEKCQVWFTLFEDFEGELVRAGRRPISLSPERKRLELEAVGVWRDGKRAQMSQNQHGDVPHGDKHGDHYDYSRTV